MGPLAALRRPVSSNRVEPSPCPFQAFLGRTLRDMIVPNPLRPMEAIHSGLFQQLLKWLDNRLSSLHAVSSDISGKTGRLPNSISATWGASCRWPTTLPTAHSAPTAFSAEDS